MDKTTERINKMEEMAALLASMAERETLEEAFTMAMSVIALTITTAHTIKHTEGKVREDAINAINEHITGIAATILTRLVSNSKEGLATTLKYIMANSKLNNGQA